MSDIQTTDWLTFTPANAVGKRRAYIDLPAFNVTGLTWKGASEVVLQYNFSASSNFVLTNIPVKPTTANYGLCIRFRVGSTTYRYKLWRDNNFVLNDAGAPLYSGQVILKNFVLEVWSFNGETTADNAAVYRVITGVRTVRSNLRDSADYALAVGTAFNNFGNQTPEIVPDINPAGTLWYRWYAGDLSNGSVDTWPYAAEASTYGFDLTQSTPSHRPTKDTVDTDVLNGYVEFDGTNDSLSGATPSSYFPLGLNFTIYAVMRILTDNSSTKATLFQLYTDSSTNNIVCQQRGFGTPSGVYDPQLGIGVTPSALSVPVPLNVWGILRVVFTTSGTYVRWNNDNEQFTATALNGNFLENFILAYRGIQNNGAQAAYSNVRFADVIGYSTQPTAAQDKQILAWLNSLHFTNDFSNRPGSPITYDSGVAWLDNP